LPEDLISRADDILTSLESNKVNTNTDVLKKVEVSNPKWVEEMKKVDPLSLSPLEALNFLYEIKRKMGDK
jgi:DNA mismatch repair ATPase MutS